MHIYSYTESCFSSFKIWSSQYKSNKQTKAKTTVFFSFHRNVDIFWENSIKPKHIMDVHFTAKCSSLKLTQNLPLQIDSRRQLVNGDWDLSLCGTRSELPVTFKFWIPPCFQASTCWFSSLSSKSFIQKCHAKVRIKAQDLCRA